MKEMCSIVDEDWIEYDSFGNVIHVKRDNKEFWNVYDVYGRLFYQKHSDGTELIFEYGVNGEIKMIQLERK